jgi:hypothetical protein
MTYEPIYERFEVVGPDGNCLEVHFVRAGVLTQGDRPELFFFRVTGAGCTCSPPEGGEETVVGISGSSLARFERGRNCLSREQKIDVTGRWLKRQIEACLAGRQTGPPAGEAGLPLDSRSLYIQDDELANLASELDFTE